MILGHKKLKGIVNPCQIDTIREAGLDLRVASDLRIDPLEFVLAWTQEEVTMPVSLMGLCNLRSSWARSGLFIPPTIVDPGFHGQLVIEIVNFSKGTIWLIKGDRFLHLIVAKVDGALPYAGQYQGQRMDNVP